MTNYSKLAKLFKRISHLHYLQRVLMWDEAVMMPVGAGQSRADALATLSRTLQKMLISKNTQHLLAAAKDEDGLAPWDKANLNWMNRNYKRAACISVSLIEKATQASAICEQAWRSLRPQNNWHGFLPYLKTSFVFSLEIAKRRADALELNVYDACIDQYAPDFNQARIDPIFAKLKSTLPSLIQKIIAKQQNEPIQVPTGPFPIQKQKALGLQIMQSLGFNFEQGRLDSSHHPFCSGGPNDVRMTTRYDENDFLNSLYAVSHETGHALYEQGLPKQWIDQPVGQVPSMAQHESQSLLIEMDLCRSREFLEYLTPQLSKHFGQQKAFTPDNIYKLITRVNANLIRVDADEVTYPLHVILRYEIERDLFNNKLNLNELPEYWDEKMTHYLGLSTKDNFQDGVMQDVHWMSGAFGYFPAYTLGRLMAAQFFATFKANHPDYVLEIKKGDCRPLKTWLKNNIYNYASLLPTDDLIVKATGSELDINFFINHIQNRYL